MGKPNKTQNSEAILSVCFSSPVLLVLFIAFLKCSTKLNNLFFTGVRTILADTEKRIQALGSKCCRKLFCITYFEHKTNKVVQSRMNTFVCPQMTYVKTRWAMSWWVKHVVRHGSFFFYFFDDYDQNTKQNNSYLLSWRFIFSITDMACGNMLVGALLELSALGLKGLLERCGMLVYEH